MRLRLVLVPRVCDAWLYRVRSRCKLALLDVTNPPRYRQSGSQHIAVPSRLTFNRSVSRIALTQVAPHPRSSVIQRTWTMANTSFLTASEVGRLGLGGLGETVLISRFASIHHPERINLGSNVRIDDFVVLSTGDSGHIDIGDHVHIAAFAALFGGGGIAIENYVGVSARSTVYSTNDDYSGAHLTNPTVPAEYTGVSFAQVRLCKHALIGAHCVILPGVCLGEGVAVGALSLVDRSLEAWGIYAGIPVGFVKPRSRALLSLETKHRAAMGESVDVADA